MSQQPPKGEFSDVDRAGDPRYYVACLDAQHAMGFFQAYKQRTFALLGIRPSSRILDVGCGTGDDTIAMAQLVGPDGEAVGLDSSQTMIEEAERRALAAGLRVTFAQGDAFQLPFGENEFDGCRADRTFQHLRDPQRALSEMVRVLKRGGRLVIADPDHESHVLDTPYPEVTRRFFAFRASTFQAGGIAHQLYALFQACGLVDVTVEAATRVDTDFAAINAIMHFDGGMRMAQQHGVVTAAEADVWIAYVEEAANAGRFFHAVTHFITTGTKPEAPSGHK